jgi:uncharacterized protein YggE
MKLFTILSSFLLIYSHALAEPEIKGLPSELKQFLSPGPKTVILTSEAEVRAAADRALVSLRVITENKSLQEALRANQELRGKLLTDFKKAGIDADRVQGAKFSSTPKFGVFKEKAKSYRVENVVKVKVQDEKEFQAVAVAVDAWQEVQYGGVEFEHGEKTALKAKAIAQACDNAMQKKKLFEDKFGLSLVPVKFTGDTVSEKLPPIFGRYGDSSSYPRQLSSASPATTIPNVVVTQDEEAVSSFGEVVYTIEIAVEYAVQTK